MSKLTGTMFRVYEPTDEKSVAALGSELLDAVLVKQNAPMDSLYGWLAYKDDVFIGAALSIKDELTGLVNNFVVYVCPEYRRNGIGSTLISMMPAINPDPMRHWRFLMTSMNFPWDTCLEFLEKNEFKLAECPPAYKEKMAVREL